MKNKKTYFFRGTAIDNCAIAEHQAQKGEIIIDNRLQGILPKTNIKLSPKGDTLAQLLDVDQSLATHLIPKLNSNQLPSTFGELFFPKMYGA